MLFLYCLLPMAALAGSGIISSGGTSKVNEISGILYKCIAGVGDLLEIFGAVKFGLAMTSDNAQKLSDGITALVVGVALANIKTIMG